jgi:hypothetical protein
MQGEHPMTSRSQRKIARQALGLSLAVPQVVAHRVGRMAAAGSRPSARDRREFTLMGAEKVAAFYESWAAMGAAMCRAQWSMWPSMWLAPWGKGPSQRALAEQALRVLGQGLAPVHRRAVGNAKRLGRKPTARRK